MAVVVVVHGIVNWHIFQRIDQQSENSLLGGGFLAIYFVVALAIH